MKKSLQRSLLLSLLGASLALCSVLDYSEEPSLQRNKPNNNNINLTSTTTTTFLPSSPQASSPAPASPQAAKGAQQAQQAETNATNSQNAHQQTMNKLQKYLNYQQSQLIEANPGSLLAVAKAIKMAIVECQFQTRHEPWDCPIHGFGVKPTDIFGKLMSRHFKETSFINSLLSAAITHSIARACTESMISTCSRLPTRDGGFSENFEFGKEFADMFMLATRGLSPAATSSNLISPPAELNNLDNNLIGTGSAGEPEAAPAAAVAPADYKANGHSSAGHFAIAEPTREKREKREKIIRNIIDIHNDAVGRLRILDGMRRECKCHGLSGACTMQTCWLKLPPFREVAQKLHDSLDQAIKIIFMGLPPPNRLKSLTSSQLPASLAWTPPAPAPPVSIPTSNSGSGSTSTNSSSSLKKSNKKRSSLLSHPNNLKKRPVARSIRRSPFPDRSTSEPTKIPGPYDLLYYEESPDFCQPDDRYNIKGTKGRICSETQNAVNNCERLCCGRGYKTEVRVEKYKCECQFKYCCKLECKTCSRRKVIHKCL